jgi:hypothetical protein
MAATRRCNDDIHGARPKDTDLRRAFGASGGGAKV